MPKWAVFLCHFGRTDVHVAIYLHGIGADDLPVQGPGQFRGKGRLANCRRTGENHQGRLLVRSPVRPAVGQWLWYLHHTCSPCSGRLTRYRPRPFMPTTASGSSGPWSITGSPESPLAHIPFPLKPGNLSLGKMPCVALYDPHRFVKAYLPNNVKRVIRALEFNRQTGLRISDPWRAQPTGPSFPQRWALSQ